MFYTIYEVKNKVNGKTYIGKHITNNLYDGYLGSGKHLKRAIKKYGEDSFEKFILYVFDSKEQMDEKEKEIVNEEFIKNNNTYNLKIGGEGGWEYVNENGLAENSKHGKLRAAAHKKRLENDVVYKKQHLKRWYENIINGWCKNPNPEIKKRRIEISGNAFRGKHHTEETKKKIGEKNSILLKGEKNPNFGKCWIYSKQKKISISIKKEELDIYLSNGWIKGRKIKFQNK